MQVAPESLRVALLGCGTVGTEVVRLVTSLGPELTSRVGAPLELSGIAVRDPDAARDPVVPRDLLTTDAESLATGADLVIELMGGIEPARSLVLAALRSGASVVTGNKALLAAHGPELYEAADAAGVDLAFEAAVAGAVPVVRGVRESLAGDRITRVLGIVNGTTNYVLDEMTTTGEGFDVALGRAQDLGYAEADPTEDVEGLDAAAKAAILASLAFHTRVSMSDVVVEGIRDITVDDVDAATRAGFVIKLLAVAERRRGRRDGIAVRVNPVLLPVSHPLSSVHGAFNAVYVEAEAAGQLMFYGPGAGGAPTAAAVLGDVVVAARRRVLGGRAPVESAHAALPMLGPDEVRTRYQMRMRVADRPGVLSQVSSIVAEHGVSIETVRQTIDDEISTERDAVLVVATHKATEAALAATAEALAGSDAVLEMVSVMRVEGE
ncbi:homoserine dehydrogenase [Georgenia sp. 10Sc9-8]|uniref:Homoserine dehydrogenase n=1 Tax=Georgenia halotolerans TaxID=3028317 RepID=A0ABT5U312_9MICO|nr:homoserine dehydrogenase [Georgenia halotolerans]